MSNKYLKFIADLYQQYVEFSAYDLQFEVDDHASLASDLHLFLVECLTPQERKELGVKLVTADDYVKGLNDERWREDIYLGIAAETSEKYIEQFRKDYPFLFEESES